MRSETTKAWHKSAFFVWLWSRFSDQASTSKISNFIWMPLGPFEHWDASLRNNHIAFFQRQIFSYRQAPQSVAELRFAGTRRHDFFSKSKRVRKFGVAACLSIDRTLDVASAAWRIEKRCRLPDTGRCKPLSVLRSHLLSCLSNISDGSARSDWPSGTHARS